MLKTIIKETKGKQLQTLQLHKPIQTFTMKKQNKPSIYQRVDKEKKRQRVIQTILFKTEYNLKRKSFCQLKFYHNIIHLRRRIKLTYKYSAFCLIQDYYHRKKEKYHYIINHFFKLQKIKVLSALYKEQTLSSKKHSILRESIIRNFNQFVSNAKSNISSNYYTFNTIRLFYFRLFTNKIVLKSYSKECAVVNLFKYKRMIRKRYQIKVIRQIKKKIRNKFKKKVLRTITAYETFISRTKHQIEIKRVLKKATKYFLIKFLYLRLISFANSFHIAESKYSVAQMFYEEKTKKKCINILRRNNALIRAFMSIVLKYGHYSKELIKDKISQEKRRIVLLLQKFSRYKKQKLIQQKKKLFRFALKLVNKKKQKIIIRKLFLDKLRKKAWTIVYSYWNQRKQFNCLLSILKSIHNSILIKNSLNLMQYKVHRFKGNNKLPQIVSYYVQNKLEAKIYKFQFKQMKKFYKKAKRVVLNKHILQKKMHLAAYFDSKKKKVKCYENFKRLIIFISCRNKFNLFLKATLCQMIQALPHRIQKTDRAVKSYQKYVIDSSIEKVVMAYSIINLDSFPFKKTILRNWLISLKKHRKNKGTTALSIYFFGKIINLMFFNRCKKKMMQIILYQHSSKLLIKTYINKLFKAKNRSLELKKKFLTIKRECMNNLNEDY